MQGALRNYPLPVSSSAPRDRGVAQHLQPAHACYQNYRVGAIHRLSGDSPCSPQLVESNTKHPTLRLRRVLETDVKPSQMACPRHLRRRKGKGGFMRCFLASARGSALRPPFPTETFYKKGFLFTKI